MKIKVGPSVLASDFGYLADEVERAELAGADYLHVDVMDGHFVDNITIGPPVVSSLRKTTKLPIHAHLMIEQPEKFVKAFADSGADIISFHIEALGRAPDERDSRAEDVIEKIKKLHKRPALAINPPTVLSHIVPLLDRLDWVLVMSVNPGFGGQAFIPEVLTKIEVLRKSFKGAIEVDGGINASTAKQVVVCGADHLAAGTYLFKSKDMKESIRGLKNVA